jgi:tRNA G26 N,N-dimethylase Trm1
LEKAIETPSILNAIDPEVVELIRENIEINRMPQGVYDEV